jgi:hypothetical protein
MVLLISEYIRSPPGLATRFVAALSQADYPITALDDGKQPGTVATPSLSPVGHHKPLKPSKQSSRHPTPAQAPRPPPPPHVSSCERPLLPEPSETLHEKALRHPRAVSFSPIDSLLYWTSPTAVFVADGHAPGTEAFDSEEGGPRPMDTPIRLVAGDPARTGEADGAAAEALFNVPSGLVVRPLPIPPLSLKDSEAAVASDVKTGGAAASSESSTSRRKYDYELIISDSMRTRAPLPSSPFRL